MPMTPRARKRKNDQELAQRLQDQRRRFVRRAAAGGAAGDEGPSGYVGPGNVAAATAWWGLRAYTTASIGTNAVRLRRSSDNVEQNFVTVAGGGLDLVAINTFRGAANLFVVTLFDQTGGGNHMQQVTAGVQPILTLNALGSRPAMDDVAGVGRTLTAASAVTRVQPFTMSCMYKKTTAGSWQPFIASNAFVRAGPPDNTVNLFNGINVNLPATDNVWHAIQGVFNGASGIACVDGANTTQNFGAAGLLNDVFSFFGAGFIGQTTEGGVWFSALTTTQTTALNSNQHAFWGF
jgi:hypothetical protein